MWFEFGDKYAFKVFTISIFGIIDGCLYAADIENHDLLFLRLRQLVSGCRAIALIVAMT